MLNRVGYRDCDRGRDTDHLTAEARLRAVRPFVVMTPRACLRRSRRRLKERLEWVCAHNLRCRIREAPTTRCRIRGIRRDVGTFRDFEFQCISGNLL